MRAKMGIAALAMGVLLGGCGAPAGFVVQQAADKPTGPVAEKPAAPVAERPAAPEAEAAKPMDAMSKTMIKRLFSFLESKNPQAKARLHSLEQRMLALDMQKVMALKAIRYNARKDKTLDDIRKEVEGLFKNPDALVADLTADLDKVAAMSAQDLASARNQLPPIFVEMMRAMTEPAKVAEHDDDDDDD